MDLKVINKRFFISLSSKKEEKKNTVRPERLTHTRVGILSANPARASYRGDLTPTHTPASAEKGIERADLASVHGWRNLCFFHSFTSIYIIMGFEIAVMETVVGASLGFRHHFGGLSQTKPRLKNWRRTQPQQPRQPRSSNGGASQP